MPKHTVLRTRTHHPIAVVEIDDSGIHTIKDARTHRVLGTYDPRTNRTRGRTGATLGWGYLLPRLIATEIDETEIDETEIDETEIEDPDLSLSEASSEGPLSPEQAQRRAHKRSEIARKIQDERLTSSDRVKDLKTRLSRT